MEVTAAWRAQKGDWEDVKYIYLSIYIEREMKPETKKYQV